MGIYSKPTNGKYRDGYDRIFKMKDKADKQTKDMFPPGNWHDGSSQTTEEEAQRNRMLRASMKPIPGSKTEKDEKDGKYTHMVYGHFPPDYK